MINKLLWLTALVVIPFAGCAGEATTSGPADTPAPDTTAVTPPVQPVSRTVTDELVEASCGQCQFGMKEKTGCDLAIRIDGKSYFVDGSSIDDHGDAHGDDGMCNCIRQARVSGEIRDGRFQATRFDVLPVADNQ